MIEAAAVAVRPKLGGRSSSLAHLIQDDMCNHECLLFFRNGVKKPCRGTVMWCSTENCRAKLQYNA